MLGGDVLGAEVPPDLPSCEFKVVVNEERHGAGRVG
jgi:hypothetical protein